MTAQISATGCLDCDDTFVNGWLGVRHWGYRNYICATRWDYGLLFDPWVSIQIIWYQPAIWTDPPMNGVRGIWVVCAQASDIFGFKPTGALEFLLWETGQTKPYDCESLSNLNIPIDVITSVCTDGTCTLNP